MPRSHTSPMDQRTQFIADYLRETLNITELCELYGVSRKTGYKWIDRYLHQGPAGLDERSRRPWHSPNTTKPEIVEAFLEVRRRHPSWGGKKILTVVHKRHPGKTGTELFNSNIAFKKLNLSRFFLVFFPPLMQAEHRAQTTIIEIYVTTRRLKQAGHMQFGLLVCL